MGRIKRNMFFQMEQSNYTKEKEMVEKSNSKNSDKYASKT